MRSPLVVVLCFVASICSAAPKPNVIFILADDLGYGELGCFGQKAIATPRLDRMAAEGMRFTQFYAGSTVCAPSRSVLMTGQHVGHTRVRGNGGTVGAQSLRADDVTVAELLKGAGYATALIGKWGLAEEGGAGVPTKKGFDHFFGYLNQNHAHNYWPAFLLRDEARVTLKNEVRAVGKNGAGVATRKVEYAPDLMTADALGWIEEHRAGPFFVCFATTLPHANNEAKNATGNGNDIPDAGRYADEPWSEADKCHAAMVTRLDEEVGALLDRLKKLGLDENTLVIFTSDNGPTNEGGHDLARFQPGGPLRGIKRDLYEGGIRMPTIARWPGKIAAGASRGHVAYFGDVMATLADLSGFDLPPGRDSLSFAPTLLGEGTQPRHDFLYWEFHERGFAQAALFEGRWKAVRNHGLAPLELYDLDKDVGEKTELAAVRPELAAKLDAYLRTARSDSADWPIQQIPGRKAPESEPPRP